METVEKRNNIPIFDINLAAFLKLNDIPPTLTMQGTRVIFEFPSINRVHTLLREYQNNPMVPILDYANTLRRLRSMMLSMRG